MMEYFKQYMLAGRMLAIGLTFCFGSSVIAQTTGGVKARQTLSSKEDDSPTETTLAIDEGAFLGYGGVRWGSSFMDGHWIPTMGVRGMWQYQEKLAFGLDFTGLTGRYHPYTAAGRRDWTQSVTTWGVAVQMTSNPRREFNYQYGLVLGRGITRLDSGSVEALPDKYSAPKTFFMVAPEAVVRWNLTKYTRPFAGISGMVPFASSGNTQMKDGALTRVYTFVGVDIGTFTL